MSNQLINENDLKKIINEKPLKKIFILSGKNSYFKTGAENIFKKLLINNDHIIFLKKTKLPEFDELERIILALNEYNPDLIIAVGGGCVMDLGKISSVLKNSNDLRKDVIESNLPEQKIELIAIPTTAGSGAEVTSNAVIYLDNIKYSVEGNLVRPDYFYLLPELLLSTHFYLDATACFDAISQSVESLFSVKSNNESVKHAKEALIILLSNFKKFFQNKNTSNSYQMLKGANFAGKAINISKTIAPHALSYPFTSLYGVPHGHAVSLTFNEILKFNYLNINRSKNIIDIKSRYQILFDLTKTNNINDLNSFFLLIKNELKLEQNFKKLNINLKADKEQILSGVNDQRLKNNPIKIVKEDIKKIFNEME